MWINFCELSFIEKAECKIINERFLWKIEESIVMWKKFDMDFKFDCDTECGFAPPPDFSIPPPPLPPYLKELPKCSEESSSDFEMCSLIPVSQQQFAYWKYFFSISFMRRQVTCWESSSWSKRKRASWQSSFSFHARSTSSLWALKFRWKISRERNLKTRKKSLIYHTWRWKKTPS